MNYNICWFYCLHNECTLASIESNKTHFGFVQIDLFSTLFVDYTYLWTENEPLNEPNECHYSQFFNQRRLSHTITRMFIEMFGRRASVCIAQCQLNHAIVFLIKYKL